MTASTPAHGTPATSRASADDDRLDEGDADDALGDGADGRRGQLGELCAAFRADDAFEDRPAAAAAGLAEGHDDAGDDERGEELQQPAADAGDETERGLRQVADLRLHALHQRRQVGVRLRPDGVHLLADDRPILRRRRAVRESGACCSAPSGPVPAPSRRANSSARRSAPRSARRRRARAGSPRVPACRRPAWRATGAADTA